jgi:large subunit ribosomal protein L5
MKAAKAQVKAVREDKKSNPMRRVRLEKITLNIGAGEPGPKLEKAQAILKKISGKKVVVTKTHKRTTFGGAKGRAIGAKVTIRGKKAAELLNTLLQAGEKKLKPSQFDDNGNFSFGIAEYINIPGVKYDPDIGIMGLDVAVTLERPGFRIKKRKIKPKKVGKHHKITKEDAMEWAQKELGVKITKGEE